MKIILSTICLALVISQAQAQLNNAMTAAVGQALAVNQQMNDAAFSGDVAVLEQVLSDDLVINDPNHRISRKSDLLALYSGSQIAYASVATTVDFSGELDGLVVIMGTESTEIDIPPPGSPWQKGDTINRRYTNVFRNEGGQWRLLIKQSTVFSVD